MTWGMLRAILTASVIGAVFLGPPLVAATEESPPRVAGKQRLPNERLLRGVLTIYIWKMTDAVKLTDKQTAQVFPLVRKNFYARWQLAMKRRNLIQMVRQAVDGAPKQEVELNRLLAQWEQNEERLQAAREGLRKALTKVLTPEQQAKSLLFEEEFEAELSRVMAQIRQENSQRVMDQNRDRER